MKLDTPNMANRRRSADKTNRIAHFIFAKLAMLLDKKPVRTTIATLSIPTGLGLALILLILAQSLSAAETVLLEAEQFTELGGWVDRDTIADVEWILDQNFRAMYGAWDALKNVDKLYPNHKLGWVAFIAGKRESRRLLGDVILDADDFRTNHIWADGAFPCSWSIDIHSPNPIYQSGHEGEEFIARATVGAAGFMYHGPYLAPYRTLYSRNITNLFMAGRDISVTHEGLGPVRVMRTCGMMGDVVGMAAALCKQFDSSPRGIYQEHLADLNILMRHGAGNKFSQTKNK